MFAARCYQCFFQVLLGNISVKIAHAQYYVKIDEIPDLYQCCLGPVVCKIGKFTRLKLTVQE